MLSSICLNQFVKTYIPASIHVTIATLKLIAERRLLSLIRTASSSAIKHIPPLQTAKSPGISSSYVFLLFTFDRLPLQPQHTCTSNFPLSYKPVPLINIINFLTSPHVAFISPAIYDLPSKGPRLTHLSPSSPSPSHTLTTGCLTADTSSFTSRQGVGRKKMQRIKQKKTSTTKVICLVFMPVFHQSFIFYLFLFLSDSLSPKQELTQKGATSNCKYFAIFFTTV